MAAAVLTDASGSRKRYRRPWLTDEILSSSLCSQWYTRFPVQQCRIKKVWRFQRQDICSKNECEMKLDKKHRTKFKGRFTN